MTITCDESWGAGSGVDLLDITWMTARDMAAHLLPYTAALLQAGALSYPFPGWESVQHLFDHLNKLTTKEDSETAAPLRAFLKEAGCDTQASRAGGARGVKRARNAWQGVRAVYEASRRKFL